MRDLYSEQLDGVFNDLSQMCRRVQTAIEQATVALMQADATIAEQVINEDERIDRARDRIEDEAFELLSLQQPVARDLRTVVAALRMVSELERMGDLSVHVAKVARLRVPQVAVPAQARPTIIRMAEVAREMVAQAADVIATHDVAAAEALGRTDEVMDRLRQVSFAELLADDWPYGVEAAVDIALLGRYYERIADHAVSIANRVIYVVTGSFPTTVDA